MSKRMMNQTEELFALVSDGHPTGQVFETRFNGGVATYRSWLMADAAKRKKHKPDLKIVRFTRDRVMSEKDWLNGGAR
ncbi:hypothetical protein ACFQ41_10200 [Lacticaseibacillus suilingensis]|uniref:Uncharacterized protein n=1 Tax=Lacticaseibacillus suilingensis TaxID=2799577 RepID=A0ABW4BGR9_9LACO|nr:hypothetical protein [Lacticaseibacillus suilingensis]